MKAKRNKDELFPIKGMVKKFIVGMVKKFIVGMV